MNISNRTFLEAVFAEATPGMHTILCGFPGDPNKVHRGVWGGRPWMPGQNLPASIRDYFNTYLTVSTFTPDELGKRRRRKSQFVAMHAVMVDDVGTKVLHSKLAMKPSGLIETSPGNYQAWLFLQQDSASRERAICERLVDRMIKAGLTEDRSDPGMRGVTRLGRLPVGVNAKAKYVEKLGRPFKVRCVEFEPSRRYLIDEIAHAWKLDMTPERPRATVIQFSEAQAKHADRRFASLVRFFQVIGRYRGPCTSGWREIICPWVHEHTDPTVTGTALAEPSEQNDYQGGFRCFHGHCAGRTMLDIRLFVQAFNRIINDRKSSS